MFNFLNTFLLNKEKNFFGDRSIAVGGCRSVLVALAWSLATTSVPVFAAGLPSSVSGTDQVVDLFTPVVPADARHMRASRSEVGRESVQLNRAITDLPLQANARFSLPRGVTYEVVYDSRQQHPSGNVTWTGYLKGYGDDYRAVITFGSGGVSGRILTPDGEFLVESDQDGEWLVDPQAAGLTPLGASEDDARIAPSKVIERARAQAAINTDVVRQKGATALAPDTTPVTIDVMILYTPGLASRLGSGLSARLDQLVALSNQAYRDSGVYINLRLVHHQQVDYSDTTSNNDALDALTSGSGAAFAGIAALRDSKGADLVSLIRPFSGTKSGGCGVSWIGGSEGASISGFAHYAYSVVSDGNDIGGSNTYCNDLSFTHEIGHNMGSMHDRAHATGQGAYPYSYGYGVTGVFGTIMSYINPVIGKFSNPAMTCAGGIACGISEGAANSANNALSLNNTRVAVAGFRSPQQSLPPAPQPLPPAPTSYPLTVNTSGSGTVTSTPAGIICGTSCSTSYTSGTSVVLTAIPASGFTFAGWSGACSGSGGCEVTMTAARTITANFSAVPSNPAQALITQYYQSILGRASDAGGLAYWGAEINRLQSLGVDVSEAFRVMAGQFFTSSEYLARNTSSAQYVTDLYRTFFNRTSDSAGLSYWTSQLAAGLPRSVLLFSFVFSNEFTTYMKSSYASAGTRGEIDVVVDFYRGFFNRLPDSDGFTYWLKRFRTAQCQGAAAVNAEVESISGQFAASSEYANRNRNNSDYVADLYYGFLRRGSDLAGFNYWVNQLNSGAQTRYQARRSFLQSPEFQSRVQQIIAQGCLS